MRSHTGRKPYQCRTCSTWFSTIGNRNDHERRHAKDKPYVCPVPGCNVSYYRKYQLVQHGKSRKHRDLPREYFSRLMDAYPQVQLTEPKK